MYSITKSSFLRYLEREILNQTKESPLNFISARFWLCSILFWPFTLKPNGTKPKEHGQRFQMERSNGSSVSARPILTNFGSVPFGFRVMEI